MKKEVSAYAKSLIKYCQENHSDIKPLCWTIDNYKALQESLESIDESADNLSELNDKELKKFCRQVMQSLVNNGKITISGIIRGLFELQRIDKRTQEVSYMWTKLTGRPHTKEALKRLLDCGGKLWSELECGQAYKWQLGFRTYVWTDCEGKDGSRRKVIVTHKGIPADIAERSEEWKNDHMRVEWVDTKNVEKGQPCRRQEFLIGYRTILRPATADRILYYLIKHPYLENEVENEKRIAAKKAADDAKKAEEKAAKKAAACSSSKAVAAK